MDHVLMADELRSLLAAQDAAARLALEHIEAIRRVETQRARIAQLENSISFRLGHALVSALQSWRGMLHLPGRLLALARRNNVAQPATAEQTVGMRPPVTDVSITADAFQQLVGKADQLSALRIVCVLDTFTYASFAPECELVQLPSSGFEAILDETRPHFLFVESAWHGLNGGWRDRIREDGVELLLLLDCCRRRGIPTVFWNKEDPSHFERFLGAAKLFDYVLTTDAGSVPRYRSACGHKRVDVLQFCCQPRIHNPIEANDRAAGACFAGSWYAKYPERSRDFASLVDAVEKIMPVAIYDRNYDRGDPAFTYPRKYSRLLRSGVPYDHIHEVYKSFRFGITVNTVKDSRTMFARRVFELMACNTIVVSNPSVGLRELFGDCAVICDDAESCVQLLARLHSSKSMRHKWRLVALRKVLQAHTAAHRLATIANMVDMTRHFEAPQPRILVLAAARNMAEADIAFATFSSQLWPQRDLALVVPDELVRLVLARHKIMQIENAEVIAASSAKSVTIQEYAADRRIAYFELRDRYGPNYLTDLALALCYSPELAVGKAMLPEHEGPHSAAGKRLPYRRASIPLRCSLVPPDQYPGVSLDALLLQLRSEPHLSVDGLAIDEFEYEPGSESS